MMRELSYQDFKNKVYQKSYQNAFPTRVMFEITYRCNFRCQHCYIPENLLSGEKKQELEFSEIREILDELSSMNVFYLGFTGGEIFVRKDIFDILWYAKRKGFQLLLSTNASFVDEKMADEIARLSPNKVDISIHSLNKQTYDEFVQREGAFDRIFKGIKLLKKKSVPMGIRTNIMEFNQEEISLIKEFASDLDANHRMSGEMQPRWDGGTRPYDFTLEPDIVDELMHKPFKKENSEKGELHQISFQSQAPKIQKPNNMNLVGRKEIKLGRKKLFQCGVGRDNLAITPSGEIKPCLHLDNPRYSIKEYGLKRAWERMYDFFQNYKPEDHYECESCDVADFCKWCPAISHVEDGDMLKCNRRSYLRAKIRKETYEREMELV